MCSPFGMVLIKEPIGHAVAANWKKVAHVVETVGFISHCPSGPLPYV